MDGAEMVGRLRPQGDRLLVRRPPEVEEEQSAGGIVIPSAWTETATDPSGVVHAMGLRRWRLAVECEVMAAGPGERDCNGIRAPMAIDAGCSVLLTGQPCDSIDLRHAFIRERDVLAVIRRTAESMTIDAAGEVVLIERDQDEVRSGLIEIPEAHRRRAWSGVVISAGPGRWATERDRHGLDVLHGGCRRFLLRGGRPYREDRGVRVGQHVVLPARVRHLSLEIDGRELLLLPSSELIAYVKLSAA